MDGGDHFGAEGEPGVSGFVLDGVAAFVSCDGGGGDGVHVVDGLAEVDRFVGGVVVIGELAGSADDADVGDAVFAEHDFSDLCAGVADGDLRVFGEAAFQGAAYEPTDEGCGSEDDEQDWGDAVDEGWLEEGCVHVGECMSEIGCRK